MAQSLLIVALAVIAVTSAQGVPVKWVCRYYSNGDKACQQKCTQLSEAETDKLVAKRPASNDIPKAQIDDTKIDPLMFYKCTDTAAVKKWDTKSNGDLWDGSSTFADALKDAPKNKKTFLGTCAFNNDKTKGWNCRTVQFDNAAGKTYIGGQSHSTPGRGAKPAWKEQNGDVQFIEQ